MNTAKVYKDIDDNDCTIFQMVKNEPEWSATRVQVGEEALHMLSVIKGWDIERFKQTGNYALPEYLRRQIQGLNE